jgi:hypothetical protein
VTPVRLLALRLRRVDEGLRLEIQNVSTAPVNVWSTRFSLGYFSLQFVVRSPVGKTCTIRRMPARWTVNIPECVTIGVGDAHTETVNLRDGTWDATACRLDPLDDLEVSAVLDIVADEDTVRHGVLTGRFESNTVPIPAAAIVE